MEKVNFRNFLFILAMVILFILLVMNALIFTFDQLDVVPPSSFDCFSFESCEIYEQYPKAEPTNYAIKIGERYGAFGDAFGILTSFFSAISCFLIAYTIWLQHNEFKLMHEDKKEAQKSLRYNQLTMYFSYLGASKSTILHHYKYINKDEKGKSIISYGTDALTKRMAAKEASYTLRLVYSNDRNHTDSDNNSSDFISVKYREIVLLGLKVFEENPDYSVSLEGKTQLLNFKSHFSPEELLLLFFECSFPKKSEVKSLIEKYEFFENLDPSYPLDIKQYSHIYNSSAYGNNPFWSAKN